MRNRIGYVLLLVALVFSPLTLMAKEVEKKVEEPKAKAAAIKGQPLKKDEPKDEPQKKFVGMFEVSIPAFYTDLEDNDTDTTTDGGSAGIRVAFTAKLQEKFFGKIEVNSGFGEVDTSGVGGGKSDFTMVHFEIAGGAIVKVQKMNLMPYVGFGSLFLNFDGTGIEVDVFGFYFCVGGKVEMKITDKLFVGFDLAVRLISAGDIEYKVTGNNRTKDLHTDLGIRMQIPVRFAVTPKLSLAFTFFYEYYSIQTGPVTGGFSRDYELHQVGAYIGGILKI